VKCPTCTESLLEITTDNYYYHKHYYSILVDIKNREIYLSKVKSSSDILKIIKFVENALVHFTNNFNSLKSGLISRIIIYAKNYVYNNIFKNVNCLDSFFENHKLHIVTLICK